MKEGKPLRRLSIGDVFEMKTAKGLAYGQLVLRHIAKPHSHGPLIRVIQGIFESPLQDAKDIASRETLYVVFCPINSRFEFDQVRKIGKAVIPEELLKFPLFKSTNDMTRRRSSTWFIWDGASFETVSPLPARFDDLPIKQITTYPLLLKRIDQEWHPRDFIVED